MLRTFAVLLLARILTHKKNTVSIYSRKKIYSSSKQVIDSEERTLTIGNNLVDKFFILLLLFCSD